MAQTDNFRKYKSLFSTTLSSSIGTGTGDTITLASVTGLPTDTEITITIDRVDANGTATPTKLERITGTISGSNLTSYTRGVDGTTEQSHSSGAVIEMIWNADDWNDALTGILTEHDQDGGHNDITADSVDSAGDINLATGKQLTVNSADPKRVISIPAGSWSPTTTSGCADLATTEAGTNDIDYKTLDFDASSDEYAFTAFQMPESWNAGTIEFKVIWTNAGGGSAETVDWVLSGRAYADDEAIDQATGTGVTVTDTWIAQGDIHESDWSSAVTLAGTPSAGEWCHFKIMRDVSEDDLTGDAQLVGVKIRYTESLATDA